MEDFNYISFADKLWIRFAEGTVSLGLHEIQSDIHFTVSFNKNDSYINLHVTRNVKDFQNKPKYEILRIKKEIADELVDDIGKYLLNRSLELIDLQFLAENNSEKIKFIFNEEIEETDFYLLIQEEMSRIAKNVLGFKRKMRLQVKKNLTEELEKFSVNEKAFLKLYNTAHNITDVSNEGIRAGIIFTDSTTFPVILINNNFYRQRNDISWLDLLQGFLGIERTKKIIYRVKKGIVIVKNADSFAQTKDMHNPLHLTKLKKKIS